MSSNNSFNLAGKTAVITGGSKGLGFAIAEAFVKHGAKVVITGRNEPQLAEACKALGQAAHHEVFDLNNLTAIPGFVKELENRYGEVEILVNNAGINMKKELQEVTDRDFEEVIRTNQQAVFTLSREFSKKMTHRQSGNIIMISSMASQYGIPKVIAYTASKAAVEGMTRAMAVELSPMGVRVNCIAPGFIETDMSAKALNGDPERKQKVLVRTPMGRLGKPGDIGNAAVYLASNAACYVTGVILPVDGGNAIGF
ncbi:MAG: SDR family oxidoreductase [Agriterribacter sp.]